MKDFLYRSHKEVWTMEKISRILPSSPRVQSTDLSSAAPVRPGTPSFGRAVGVSTNHPDTKAAREVATIQALSDAFFMQNKKTPEIAPVTEQLAHGVDELDQPEVGRYLDVQV
jgi:hypothetical protein